MKKWFDDNFDKIVETGMLLCMIAVMVLLWVYTIAFLQRAGA